MSIAPLLRMTLWGRSGRNKATALTELQALGCVHLEPLTRCDITQEAAGGAVASSREALRYLLSCPQQRRPLTDETGFDAGVVERRALAIRHEIADLRDEVDALEKRIAELEPWGNFDLSPLAGRRDVRLWFYPVPHYQLSKVEQLGLNFEVVAKDHRFCYVVVVSKELPKGIPARRTRTGKRSLGELQRRLAHVEVAIEDLEAERASLTRWTVLLARSLDRLDDQVALMRAAAESFEDEGLFAVTGWVPQERVGDLEALARRADLALVTRPPHADEEPPTLLANRKPFDSGSDLVRFYTAPGYWTWDPSATVLLSFTLFFAMILADAGYGVLLGLVLLALWRRLGASDDSRRLRRLGTGIVAASISFGVLAGSYFGLEPPAGGLLARFHVIDMNDTRASMRLSLAIGAIHLVGANLAEAFRLRRRGLSAMLAPLGWALVIGGGFALGIGATGETAVLASVGQWTAILGGALVAIFSGWSLRPLARAGMGLVALTKVTAAFGDVLSYLRLFALGFASSQLAFAFNSLARDLVGAKPGIGLLLALVALIIGHGLNLVLGVMSGVVHGLRLNLIEFFNWSVTEEGRAFSAFRRKGDDAWTPSS